MTLKDRKFVVELTETEIRELYDALEQRRDALNDALKNGGGVITQRHFETVSSLCCMTEYLKRECDHGFGG